MYRLNKLTKRALRKLSNKEVSLAFEKVRIYHMDLQEEYYRREAIEVNKRLREFQHDFEIEQASARESRTTEVLEVL